MTNARAEKAEAAAMESEARATRAWNAEERAEEENRSLRVRVADLESAIERVEAVVSDALSSIGDYDDNTVFSAVEKIRTFFSEPIVKRGAHSVNKGDVEDSAVDHPAHYTSHPSGIECIDVTEHMTFNVGNATKYLWRAGLKGAHVEDLKKARWYVDREIQRMEKKTRKKDEVKS